MRKNALTKVEREIIDRVVQARGEVGLDRGDLAEALALGENSYAHYERYRSPFTIDQLIIIARLVNKPVAWLLGLKTELTGEEMEILHLFRQIPNDQARRLALESLRLQVRVLGDK